MNLRIKKIILWLLLFLTRWLWRLTVFITIAVAVLVSAGREMAPLLHKHKPWLEARLTASTGELVKMEQVDAYWEGLIPELMVKKLTIGNVLQVDSALLRVDLLASARSLAPVFDTLDVSHASVTIPVSASATEQPFDMQEYLNFVFGSADIRVRNLEIILQKDAQNQLPLQVDELTVINNKYTHWLNATIAVGKPDPAAKKNPLQLAIKFEGDANNIFLKHGLAHIDLGDEKNLARLWDFTRPLLSEKAISRISGVDTMQGQLWLSWKHERIDWVAETSISALAFAAPKKYTVDFSGQLAGYVVMEDMLGKEYFIHNMRDEQITINRQRYMLPVFSADYKSDMASPGDGLFATDSDNQGLCKIYLPDFNLATLKQYLDLLPSKELRNTLQTLNPSGELKNVLLSLPVVDEPTSQQTAKTLLQANLANVSVSAWQGAPALSSVNGYLETSANAGFVELDSRQGFSMFYKTLYRNPMKYDRAAGRVQWQLEPHDQHIYVGSQDLDFHADDGELRGAFWLDIPPAHSPDLAELYLSAGLLNTEVKYRNKYLPYTLNPALSRWLAGSLKAGKLSESGFIYRGPLIAHKTQTQEQTLMFFTRVKDGSLQFDPAWPTITDADASVIVDNEDVHASVKKAHFMDFTVNQASADLRVAANKQGHFLVVQASGAGPGKGILNVLSNTPLQKIFGNVFDGWQLGGNTRGHVNLGLRVGAAEEQEYQELDLHLPGNNLLVGKIDLPIKDIEGDVHYSSTAGLSSTPLTASLWGQDQLITMVPVVDGDGLPDVSVSMTGNIDTNAAAIWSHLSFVHFLKGVIPMAGTLNVPLDTTVIAAPVATLSIKSDMKGVSIDLPEPFKKTAATSLLSTLNIELWKDKQKFRGVYGELVSSLVEQNNEGKLKGDIVINQQDKPAAELPDFLRIRGHVDSASLADWMPVMDRYNAFVKADALEHKKLSAALKNPSGATESIYPVFDLLVKQLSIGGLKLDDMKLRVNYQQNAATGNYWNVVFDNVMMTGNYRLFDDNQRLPEVDFDTVKLGEPMTAEEKEQQKIAEADDSSRVDPLADVVPQDLPALRVHAKQVVLKGDDVGDWRYTLHPNSEGVVLDDLYVSIPGLTIDGKQKESGAVVHWYRSGNEMNTTVDAHLNLTNQDGVEKLLGIKRMMEADKTDIQLTAGWNGSPAMLSFRRLQGSLSVSSEKGRFLESNRSTDVMRVIAVLNFSEWARRLKLDFADVTKKGISFDKVTTQVKLDRGKVTFDQPMVMVGPSGRFELKGTIDSVQNLIDASLIVTIPVNNNAAWIAGLAAGLPVAAGVWVASKIFGDQIDKLSSVNYSISGTLDKPTVKFVSLLPELSKEDKNKKPAEINN